MGGLTVKSESISEFVELFAQQPIYENIKLSVPYSKDCDSLDDQGSQHHVCQKYFVSFNFVFLCIR